MYEGREEDMMPIFLWYVQALTIIITIDFPISLLFLAKLGFSIKGLVEETVIQKGLLGG